MVHCGCKSSTWNGRWATSQFMLPRSLHLYLNVLHQVNVTVKKLINPNRSPYTYSWLALYIPWNYIVSAGWSDGSGITIDCYSQLQNLCFFSPLSHCRPWLAFVAGLKATWSRPVWIMKDKKYKSTELNCVCIICIKNFNTNSALCWHTYGSDLNKFKDKFST